MNQVEPSERLEESDWLAPRLSGYRSVTSVVPDGFSAYVRILHPARSRHNAPVRWAQIAEWAGRVMHRLTEFHHRNATERHGSSDFGREIRSRR